EREERIGGGHRTTRALRALGEGVGPLDGELAGVHAVHLPHADPHGGAVVGEQDRVGLSGPHGAPGEGQVGQGLLVRGVTGRKRPGGGVVAGGLDLSRCCISMPPEMCLVSIAIGLASPSTSTRRFFLRCSTSSAPSAYPGAMITSVNTPETCSAISTETWVLAAITPPKAETGSQACALVCASAIVVPTAMPHGLACLMIATVGASPWSWAARQAASVST